MEPSTTFLFILLKRLKELFGIWTEKAKITVRGEADITGNDKHLIYTPDQNGRAILRFSIGSTSKKPIEILGVQVEYSFPLQLIDLDQGNFFKSEVLPNNDRAFCLVWRGSATTGNKIIQIFAALVISPLDKTEHDITIKIITRRIHKRFGFISLGKDQETQISCKLKATTSQTLGIMLSPGWSATSPQPFIITSEHYASTDGENDAQLVVHELDKNGATSTKEIKVKSIKKPSSQ